MIAASVWSLLIPSIDMAGSSKFNWVPASIGFLLGILFLSFVNNDAFFNRFDSIQWKTKTERKHGDNKHFIRRNINKTIMMVLAVTIHNIPEGMAVGVIFAGAISNNAGVSMAGAFALAIGIGIQNFPEGAIISMPLKSQGVSKNKAFLYGVLSRCC